MVVSLAQAQEVCQQIEDAITSASAMSYFGARSYFDDIFHWASSSTELAQCSVQPGTAEDVGIILGIIGKTRTPFAVKGGGHTTNVNFSSTTGVQIAMTRFSEVTYDAQSQTAVIGSGLIWDDVYEALAPYNVNVVGGRVSGVGVAGFTLGGGYSYLSNQYGLTIDNVVAFELVTPDGSVANVTETSDPELFFSLKGGLNNYGIVTRFTMRTYPQGQVWGGLAMYVNDSVNKVTEAIGSFVANVTDPKAMIVPTYNFGLGSESTSVLMLMFYDDPTPPEGMFEEILSIPYASFDVRSRDFLSLVSMVPSAIASGTRKSFNAVPILKLTPNLLRAVFNETEAWGRALTKETSRLTIGYDVVQYHADTLSHASSPSAYPPTRDAVYSPLTLYYDWTHKSQDETFHNAIRESVRRLESVAVAEGQVGVESASVYPNNAIFDTPVERIYGENLGRMRATKSRVDPENVMGLAGGFKI
ncbi:hypothetical protein V5O48_014742 [Marasmius crinis-equi]|uniref:FAD-binding PCMH-type domain-containing protein n=1 Tax=Marasmius crinis-equi TaxID=585013 RepID=A0ABR3EWG6_9AGAR